jgi:hypothetical protein
MVALVPWNIVQFARKSSQSGLRQIRVPGPALSRWYSCTSWPLIKPKKVLSTLTI